MPPSGEGVGGNGIKGAGFIIPHRTKRGPVVGTRGRKTEVEVNHLLLSFTKKKSMIAVHYDVDFKPDAPKRLFRYVLRAFYFQRFYLKLLLSLMIHSFNIVILSPLIIII